jgi:hypothetical protein
MKIQYKIICENKEEEMFLKDMIITNVENCSKVIDCEYNYDDQEFECVIEDENIVQILKDKYLR